MRRWNIEFLKQLYSKYQKLAETTEDPTLSLEYEDIANSALDVIDRYYVLVHKKSVLSGANEFVTHKSIISGDFSVLRDYGYYCPYIREFAEYNSILEINPNPDATLIEFDSDRLISLCSRFYHQLGGTFADEFGKISQSFDDTIHIRKLTNSVVASGQTYSIYKTNISFFELAYNKTIQDYVSAIHEFGHGIVNSINPEAIWDFGTYCFSEVASLFFELVGTDYIGTELGIKKDAFDINMHVLKDYIYSAKIMSLKFDMYTMCDRAKLNNKKYVKDYLKHAVGIDNTTRSDVLNFQLRECMHYVISYLIAIELYLIYQQSPEVAFDLLHKIIVAEKNSSKEYLDYVVGLGLEPGKNFEKYLATLFDKAKDFKDEKSLRYKN